MAFLAMAWTAASGYQSAIMAPTEVLARQHYESYCQMSEQFGLHFPIVLLTGSMTAKEKRLAYQTLDEEKDALVIGTHALIQEKAIYSNLALVITDEQHRFGVRQRETFAEKGRRPHILVMSATPIPRTLAIILYGDLDISVIDEVPARRLPIKNCVVNTGYRPKAYAFIEEQVRAGHQAYIICPLVEGSENMEGENVTDYAGKVKSELPSDIEVSVLHGKMKNDKKNEIMNLFAQNKVQVLVSTTVVEVGVNVPNATVMMIENADRFGLAQLHQLRGRVGRGDAQSYCIMINTSQSKNAKKRLEILNQSNDELTEINGLRPCGNDIINTVFYIKSKEAKAENIELNVEVDIQNSVKIKNIDLARILLNLCDNAINATKECDKKEIYFSITASDKIIKIDTKNPFINRKKVIQEGHGNGTKIIKEIAEKHGGDYKASSENGIYTTHTTLRNIEANI